jgi:hypothetical protein
MEKDDQLCPYIAGQDVKRLRKRQAGSSSGRHCPGSRRFSMLAQPQQGASELNDE